MSRASVIDLKPMNPTLGLDGELWVPRTMWEKRRQLSAILHRSLSIGRSTLVMSCDDYHTFFSRIDVPLEQSRAALANHQIEYLQVAPLFGTADNNATDLSRIMGPLGGRLGRAERPFEQVVLDDVDLILDLRSEEAAVASMCALLYALKARFRDIVLFANPLRSDWELEYLTQMRDLLVVHAPTPVSPPHHQNVA